jgi:hypothetical protein
MYFYLRICVPPSKKAASKLLPVKIIKVGDTHEASESSEQDEQPK